MIPDDCFDCYYRQTPATPMMTGMPMGTMTTPGGMSMYPGSMTMPGGMPMYPGSMAAPGGVPMYQGMAPTGTTTGMPYGQPGGSPFGFPTTDQFPTSGGTVVPPSTVLPPSATMPSAFQMEPGAPVQQDINYNQGWLRTQIGQRVLVTFLLGTNSLQDRAGTLIGVGISYILLREAETDDVLMADIYSIKFVRVYR